MFDIRGTFFFEQEEFTLMLNDAILNVVYSLVAFNIGFAGFLNRIPIKMEKVSDLTPL